MFDALDGRAGLTQIAKQQRDASTSLTQLQCGVNATRYGLHVVFDTYEKTADRLSTLRFTEVEESGRRRLETQRRLRVAGSSPGIVCRRKFSMRMSGET